MNAFSISILVFCVIFSGALIGMFLRDLMPRHHLNADSKEVVKLSMGLVATLTALVLGLLVASARSSFDAKNTHIRQLTANFTLLDAVLEQYGPEARNSRLQLRNMLPALAEKIWKDEDTNAGLAAFQKAPEGEAYFREVQTLNPRNEAQRLLRDRIYQATNDIAQTRLLLHAQTGNAIRGPFLAVMVFWLFALFVSFGLFGRASSLTIGALFVCAISVSGAVFLILELDRAFTGVMAISSEPLRNALLPLR
jgi:hypothetical protein